MGEFHNTENQILIRMIIDKVMLEYVNQVIETEGGDSSKITIHFLRAMFRWRSFPYPMETSFFAGASNRSPSTS